MSFGAGSRARAARFRRIALEILIDLKQDQNRSGEMGILDGSGWKWMEVDGSGWKWMEVDGSGWKARVIVTALFRFPFCWLSLFALSELGESHNLFPG
ncbi:unnamed protein product [Darwinula stevensoni]|uniref:Uncharacterized protein n=1 Tax=Darwinula stevensoni TaxID=69355 RepID=A0A7R9AC04_9CRUS|nr:unnamed protein product [Darwinula stevensoni]CAG0899419.1 unnamed protein product [Darwinula stevensoni]